MISSTKRSRKLVLTGPLDACARLRPYLDQISDVLGTTYWCVCDQVDCFQDNAPGATAVVYLKGFPASYETVRDMSACSAHIHHVLGLEYRENRVRVWNGNRCTDWFPEEAVAYAVEMAVPEVNVTPLVSFCCTTAMLLSWLLHMLVVR